jgi:pyruvate/2-oxoglutarate dehydrogenase complex dihydrolipoamide acyltransferase (E2) component
MGDSISDGSLIEILKQPGDGVKENEIVARIETDKVAIDIRAERDGKVISVPVKIGENVKVGAILMEIDASAKSSQNATQAAPAVATAPPSVASFTSVSSSSTVSSYTPKIRFVHGKGRNEMGDFANYPVHKRSNQQAQAAPPAPVKSSSSSSSQPTLSPAAYWASNPSEFQTQNEKAANAMKSLPILYRRQPMKALIQNMIDMGGAPDYEIKKKGKTKE